MEGSVIDEYFKIYKESVEQYGEKTVVLIEFGSFYEIYSIENENEKIGNANIISEIIRCDFTSKNKAKRASDGYSTRSNPDFCGFGTAFLRKYIPPLLNENYTVVIINQLEDAKSKKGKTVKRGITAVYSPTLKSPEFETINDAESNLIGIFIEVIYSGNTTANSFLYSVCSINNVTNDIEVCDGGVDFYNLDEFGICLDDLNRILLRYNMKEIQINIIDDDQSVIECVDKYFGENYKNFKINIINQDDEKYKEYTKPIVQNEYFSRVYNHLSFGLLNPLEFLNLSTKPLCIINLMYIFDFIGKHDLKYLSNLSIPKVVEDTGCLVLALNTLSQLNIVDNTQGVSGKFSSVYDTVNFTSTAIGRRYLKRILTKPFRNYDIINFRYNLTEEMRNIDINKVEKILTGFLDFERMHRKMALEALHPYEFEKLDGTYTKILELIKMMLDNQLLKSIIPDDEILELFNEYIKDYSNNFNKDVLKIVNLNTKKEDMSNIFNRGVVKELDEIEDKIKYIEDEIIGLRMKYDTCINENVKDQQFIKIEYTDQDGHFFTCTKLRFEKLKGLLSKDDVLQLRIKSTNNTIKFFTDELVKKSYELINNRELFTKNIKMNYLVKLREYSTKYNKLFTVLKEFIEIVDITKSNLKCALKYNYCKPDIVNEDDSYLEAYDMRHSIIERIVSTEYVPNDIKLDKTNLGIVLYGLNACGKSTLLRAIGICVILAQCGLYVPCRKFKYSAFNNLISQVDLTDNLFMGKSSFITEMIGLKKILSVSGKNTLILSDELCKGTETSSAEAIVASSITRLIKDSSKFFFTSHLHGIPDVKGIKNNKKLQISHLSISLKQDKDIIFERKIKEGSGSRLYGLEVCKSIIQDMNFIDNAFEIRNDILGNKTDVVSKKKSNYNKKKTMTSCQVCGYKPKDKKSVPLESHHINEQQNTDEKGFVNDKHFHKNELYNLVCLCKSCHQKIDTGELIIRGYKQSVSGLFLDWEWGM
jgi:DNA mismatch repair protein MutS